MNELNKTITGIIIDAVEEGIEFWQILVERRKEPS